MIVTDFAEGQLLRLDLRTGDREVTALLSVLLDAVREGRVHLNLHTAALPAGAIRGQVVGWDTAD